MTVPSLDEFLHPFDDLFAGLADLDGALHDDVLGVAMHVERVLVDLPVELDVSVAEDGRVTMLSAPPTQHVETTWMPVLHRIRMTLEPS